MIKIADALNALLINEWTLTGEPSNEAEFNAMFKKIIGIDADERSILSEDPNDFGVTWSQVKIKYDELQADYDAKQYQRDRAVAYPSIQDQLDMQYWDSINGTTTWADAITTVKQEHPKP